MAKQLTLPDGRNLDYSVTGASDGFPLVWLHGTPSSYIEMPSLIAACKKRGMKLISFSRAGYGGSSRNKGRRIIDNVADVQALLQHLGHDRCVVGGWSGGGPHTLACAARLKGCQGVLVIASVAPYDAEGLDFLEGQGQDNIDETNASLQGEAALRKFVEPQREEFLKSDVPGVVEMMSSILPTVDKKIMLESDELGEFMLKGGHEGLKNGVDGWVDDDLAFIQPWGFDLAEISVPCFLYHGSDDLMCPFAHGQWLSNHVPQASLRKHLEQGEGHVSLFLGRVDAMLDELKGTVQS